ncbi:hypothetical protein, partial [Streptosporangium canum]|uniref:hypothetical protein n=1 Tax=Streptosporangium canum TaxID=324952 RepID=UPI0037A392D6
MQTVTPVHEAPAPEKRTSTTLAWGCLLMVVLPVIGLFLLLKIPMWINDAKLTKMMDQARDYPLPPETSFFGHDDDVEGSMEKRGNGDGCDYRVRLSLETLLSEEEIVDYYRKASAAFLIAGRRICGVGFGAGAVVAPRSRGGR